MISDLSFTRSRDSKDFNKIQDLIIDFIDLLNMYF